MPTQLIYSLNREIVNPLIVLLIGIAFVYFIWGLFQFLTNADSSQGRADGKRRIIWGLVGLFIMVSVYGILQILLNTFGITPPPNSGFPGPA